MQRFSLRFDSRLVALLIFCGALVVSNQATAQFRLPGGFGGRASSSFSPRGMSQAMQTMRRSTMTTGRSGGLSYRLPAGTSTRLSQAADLVENTLARSSNSRTRRVVSSPTRVSTSAQCQPQPRPAPLPPKPAAPEPQSQDPVSQVRLLIAASKEAFQQEDFAKTVRLLDRAHELLPENGDVLQFRSMAEFAQQHFDEAAADAYDALLVSNTWNWDAILELYGSPDAYIAQLRRLEQVTLTEPSLTNHFLLGYHYLVLEHLTQGRDQLEKALALQPEEPLLQQLVSAVRNLESQATDS